jgi:hypothetical protein
MSVFVPLHLFFAVLNCHLWRVWLYHIFLHYLKRHDLGGGEVTEHKICCLNFSKNVSGRSYILRRIQADIVIIFIGFHIK